MDPITALGLVKTAIEVAPIVISGIQNLTTFGVAFYERLTGKPATAEERADIEAMIEKLHSEFQAPIPPEDQQ